GPDHLAYCIYTSGSTGAPKGVLVPRRGPANLCADWQRRYPVSGDDCFSLWTRLSFDVSVWEWLLPLSHGASLAIPPEEARARAQDFLAWAKRQRVSVAYLPPHIVRSLAAAPEGSLPGTLLVGVEPLNENSVRAHSRGARVANGYGPTEATVYCTLYTEGPAEAERNLPIGRPIGNMRIYLLDEDLNPVPAGARGEIFIGGAGLARGYLNRPELTAEKFLPDPYGEPGGRMYRSGDQGRYLPDGNLEYLGRQDGQVKLRGYRIEPGEVEHALSGLDGVREAAVQVVSDERGEAQLAAYVARWASSSKTLRELREALRRRLPDYMVPTAWVELDALPLNANGKIDRKALAEIPLRETEDQTSVDSRTDMGSTLRGVMSIFDELFPGRALNPASDLFACGIHSLQLMQVASRCHELFSVELRMRDLHRCGSPRGVAMEVEKKLESICSHEH
ncbi:non-ribosomal peptide synthetase, partial [Chromobacterium vaccinii]|uniref:non-ribosomal peptide synthetase n=1 Tax=Chromobacterium vaccinii TaxID=1108595 RepID=UPI00326098D0